MPCKGSFRSGRLLHWLMAGVLLAAVAGAGCGSTPVSPTPPVPPPPVPEPIPPPPLPPPPPPPPPTLRFAKLMAFGDSITEGKTSSLRFPMLLEGSPAYPIKLQAKLAARYTNQTITVANEGFGGESAEDGPKRLPIALQDRQPELVLLMEGVNDLNALGSSGISRATAAIDRMVKTCRGLGLAVMLAGIPPQRPGGSRAGSVALVGPYNDSLREVARSNGVEFVDIAAGFQGDLSLLGVDGLHPTDAGYDRITEIFYDRIVAVFDQPASSTK